MSNGGIHAEAPVQAKPRAVSLEPYNEVHTPSRNFGPATLANGDEGQPSGEASGGKSGVDLANVKGSGPHGRIHAEDVKAAKAVTAVKAPAAVAAPAATPIPDAPFERVPLDAMRRTIARRLVEAKQTVPHFYLSTDVNLDSLLEMRERANAELPAKLSINDFIIKAYAVALQRVPAANAIWAEGPEAAILRFRHSDVGVAVAIEGGLLTPVICQAETKSLSTISTEMKDLAARARERKTSTAGISGRRGCRISNLGMYGIREFSAIINPPQATILAVGGPRRQPIESPTAELALSPCSPPCCPATIAWSMARWALSYWALSRP